MSANLPQVEGAPEQLVRLLYPGEIVLWVGSPEPARYAKQMQTIWGAGGCLSGLVTCALGLAGFAAVGLAQGAIMSLPSPYNWVVLFAFAGGVIYLLVFIWQLGVGSIATTRATDMVYAITDRRLIESRPGHTRTYLPGELDFLKIRRGSGDVGDVLFTTETVPDSELPPTDVEHGFIGVKDPDKVGAIMQAAFPQAPFVRFENGPT
jgi:hypothetical protein